MNLRKWQQNALNICLPAFQKGRKLFVVEGCTGSGKTLFSAVAAIQSVERRYADLIIVLTPNCGTKLGWKKTFAGLSLNGKRVNVTDNVNFPLDTDVWVSTYAGYSKIEEALSSRPVSGIIVIIDELHHAEDSAEWGKAVDSLVSMAEHAIFLSGTPWRREGKIAVLCDSQNIHQEDYYQEDGRIKSDFIYNYENDLRERTTRGTVPVKFKFWDSFWRSPDGKSSEFYKDLPSFPSKEWNNIGEWEEWAQKCDASLGKHLQFDLDHSSPADNETVRRIIDESLVLLDHTRRQIEKACERKNLSILLCVAKSIKDARRIAEYIQELRPMYRVSVVVSDDHNGAKKLEKIAKQCKENAADKPDVIVSVGMISEGVDIPQIKVVAYLSAILTVLYFIQVVGRAIRRIPLDSPDRPYADVNISDTIAHVVAPAHPKLRYIARNIEKNVQDACRELGQDSIEEKSIDPGDALDRPRLDGTVTSGESSIGIFRGSEDFSQWHEVIEAMRVHSKASECFIDSHWSEHILSLFLRGGKDAESHAINEINARCECLGVSASELISQVEEQIETVFSYEEEQKKLSESAIYWTNIIRFRVDKYRAIVDNDQAYRKVRGDINSLAGLKKAGVTFSKASIEQRREWVKMAKAVAEKAQ
jgi:superfamily II DNA or RNA helicase